MRVRRLLAAVAVLGSSLIQSGNPGRAASSNVITTIAGGVNGGPALERSMTPRGIALLRGKVYFSDQSWGAVRALDEATGKLATIAGTGVTGYGGDGGPARSARLSWPFEMVSDPAGNTYVADRSNHRVRKIAPGGTITTVAGTGQPGFSGNGGPATLAWLRQPQGLAMDLAGNLFIADTFNNRVRKVSPSGVITNVAGTGANGSSGDGGPANSATLSLPSGLAFDPAGNLFITDVDRIRKVTPQGIISTYAGTGLSGYSGDGGPATLAQLAHPLGLAIDAAGNLFIADADNDRIRKVAVDGTITTVAGIGVARSGLRGFAGDGGSAVVAMLHYPNGVAVDESGSIYIADTGNRRIRKVDPAGTITTIAGTGDTGQPGDGALARSAHLAWPFGMTFDAAANLYIVDRNQHRVRMRDPKGIITTVAGNGVGGFSGDGGLASSASLRRPQGIALDPSGNIVIADTFNNRVRRVDRTGVITTIAGDGRNTSSGDGGPAALASLGLPNGPAFDAAGNLYVAAQDRIRKITPEGIISTVAGTGLIGFSGDGVPAIAAELRSPQGVAFDAAGNLYIADAGNNRIRRVDASGIITTVAGNGSAGSSGDGGLATGAGISYPNTVAVRSDGTLFIAETGGDRVRQVSPEGIISTFAGTGTRGFSGDGGPATSAMLGAPRGIVLDAAGNVYVSCGDNNRVRKIVK